jgi:hypothetical protein
MRNVLYGYSGFGADSTGVPTCPPGRVMNPATGQCVRMTLHLDESLIRKPPPSAGMSDITYVAIGGAAIVAAYLIFRSK